MCCSRYRDAPMVGPPRAKIDSNREDEANAERQSLHIGLLTAIGSFGPQNRELLLGV